MGLGLAIVQRLATLLGHRVDVDSRLGRGSRFSITVPRTIVRHRQCGPHDPHAAPSETASHELEGRRIVVVDDDPAVVAAMQALFASWKAIATGGADSASALAALASRGGNGTIGVDLIIADLRLADGASGIDAVARLRDALGLRTPALIVSGDTSSAARAEVHAAGIHLLLKPVVPTVLKDAAEAALLVPGEVSRSRVARFPHPVLPG